MSRTYFKKVGGRNYKSYNSIALQKAVRIKLMGISSEKFGVLKNTICCNHMKVLEKKTMWTSCIRF